MNTNSKTRILVESALLIAISTVLATWVKFKFLPYGGSITICSMLPIIIISYRHGLKWGFLASFAHALIQIITGYTPSGMGPFGFVMELLFDYIVAFTILGIGGLFRGKFGSPSKELVAGSFLALLGRFISHCISGYFVWGEYAEWFFGEAGGFGQWAMNSFSGKGLALFYSIVYNATYMIPEIIITCIVAGIIAPRIVNNEE